jgi:hypothetical protein
VLSQTFEGVVNDYERLLSRMLPGRDLGDVEEEEDE